MPERSDRELSDMDMMTYHGPVFLVCVGATFLVWCVVHRNNLAGKCVLLAASCAWYAGTGVQGCAVLFAVTALTYSAGLAMGERSAHGRPWRRIVCISALVLDVAALVWFKYHTRIMGGWGARFLGNTHLTGMIMPLGMSFFVFQSVAYVVDVYRGTVVPTRNPVDAGLLMAFFPKVAVGPLVRPREFLGQCATARRATPENIARCVELFAVGLFKKACLADTLGLFVDGVFAAPASRSSLECVLAVVAYSFQIYYDFSGCIDMVRGFAALFDYALPANFNQPYTSLTVSEFWRRWHMTLSTWLRDYVFLPTAYAASARLGFEQYWGIKVENIVYAVASMVTMAVCGAWHGVGCTFVAWGLYYGVWLVVERLAWPRATAPTWKPSAWQAWLHWSATACIVAMGWLLFRARSFAELGAFAHACGRLTFSVSMSKTCMAMLAGSGIHMLICVAWRVWQPTRPAWSPRMLCVLAFCKGAAAVALLILAMVFSCETMVPYIYAQF